MMWLRKLILFCLVTSLLTCPTVKEKPKCGEELPTLEQPVALEVQKTQEKSAEHKDETSIKQRNQFTGNEEKVEITPLNAALQSLTKLAEKEGSNISQINIQNIISKLSEKDKKSIQNIIDITKQKGPSALLDVDIVTNIDIVKYMIACGADVLKKDLLSNTVLHIATKHGYNDLVKWLLKNTELKNNDKNFMGDTPLLIATQNNNIELIKWLIEHDNADINEINIIRDTPILIAADNGYIDTLIWLIKTGKANINAQNLQGDTVLHIMAGKGNLEIVKILNNTDMTITNKYGNTALYSAIINNHLETVKWLVKFGNFDINIRNDRGDNALNIAALNYRLDIVKWLVEDMKVDVNAKNEQGVTALHRAAEFAPLPMIQYLVSIGGKVNEQNNEGNTVLHLAIRNIDMVKWLVEKGGADVNIKNNKGQNVLDYANEQLKLYNIESTYRPTIEWLKQYMN